MMMKCQRCCYYYHALVVIIVITISEAFQQQQQHNFPPPPIIAASNSRRRRRLDSLYKLSSPLTILSSSVKQQPSSYYYSSSLKPFNLHATANAAASSDDDEAATDDSDSSNNNISSGGTATIPNEVFNLVKAIVGAGVLTLPAGIATYGNAPSAIIPAIILITLIGTMSGYGFALIGRVCAITNTTTYKSAWEVSISKNTSWIPAISVICKTMFSILAYSMILGDTFHALILSLGYYNYSKTIVLIIITTTILLPLCLLKNLSSLAPFSLLGSIGMIYTAIAMTIRYINKSYINNGTFALDIPTKLRPSFGTNGAMASLSPTTAILLGMLSTAYMAHFNAPKFYIELKNNTVPRFIKVVSTSFSISILLFSIIASIGFLTFGGASAGLILNNYSTRDTLMSLSRVAVAISLVFSYPLSYIGFRDGLLDIFKVNESTRSSTILNTIMAITILSAITILALIIPDVSFVLAFAGATLGNGLIYVFPGLMFRGAIKKLKNPTKLQLREVKLAISSAIIGTGLGLMGAYKAIQSIL